VGSAQPQKEDKTMSLQYKICLITGGAAGIGRATAEKFVAGGATVVICDLNEAAGSELFLC
jgi:3-oxoacyl-[acyl-carrier protein] reductase